ncbi:unnamed protein product [Fraxinus pennsylvanica]|uniref:BAG domain-containing protein n=1 Tax=Fraxinus pennsylvanica TaxID=56036 RepID=A0AAD1Z824_9LAMI|nr:unnamed protein product [Fraxinus pennsylvanica]
MDPVYRCMQPYPYQRGQVHYRPYYYPSTEPVWTPMYADPAPFPMHYECCPWGGSYGYSYPVHGHGCCNPSHSQENYAWRPHSHVPPVHCHRNHPSFQAPHTIPYIPVPDYSIGNPRYEYEKNMPRDHHCCGCPNHQRSKKEEKNVRIEEEDPDKEMKSNESLVPLQLKNYRHPIVWFPSEYGNNEEHKKSKESEYTDQKEDLHDNRKIIEQKPAVLPNDVNNSGSLKKSGDQVRNQNQQDDGKGNFPFPIFWMPYKPEEMEKKEGEVNNVCPEPSMESFQLPYSGGNLKMNGERTNHNASSRTKDIPVKQVEQLLEKENTGNHKAKENNASVKDFIDNGDEKCTEGSAQRKSTSPKKASLPPVCLRVDPLPRRKNTNGSSRSPSPPGDKWKLNQSSNQASIVPSSTEIVKSNVINDDESRNGTTNKKPIEVMEGKTEQGGDVDVNTTHAFEKDIQANQADERFTEDKLSRECTRPDKADVRGQSNDGGSQIAEEEELSRGEEVIANEIKEPEIKKLTDLEAAIVIQSAYRGFAIRRWEPLKKLKQIAKVREQIAVIKLLIQEMELSSDIQRDNKQIHMIGETIMSLLLKLDTVQGLHPSIRDIRKSVARELVCFQEKLDSLIDKKPSHGHESINGVDEGALKETKNDASIQDGHRVENSGVDSFLPKNNHEAEAHLVEWCHGQSVNMEISEPMLVGELEGGNLEKNSTEISESCGIERIEAGPKPDFKLGDEQDYKVQENKEESISFQLTESGQDMTDSPTIDGVMSPSELAELPPGVLDGDVDAQGCMKHRQIKSGEHEVAVNELMADVEQAKEIEEGSKAESVTTELKDNNGRDGNKVDIELCEEPLSKSNDIQVQAEGNLSINNEFVKIYDKTDEKIGSEEVMVDKLRDVGGAGAESDEHTSQPSQNTGAKMKEPKAADNKTGSEVVVEDKLGDAIPEPDECTYQPSCTTGPKISEPKGGDDKNGSEDVMDDELGDAGADLREKIVEEKLGDSMTESDECPSQPPYYTGSKIKEPEGAGDKIGSEEMVDDKLKDAIAESYKCTRLPKDAGAKINEPTETPDELKLQMGEPFQGENEIDNRVPEAFGGNDPKNSSTYEEVLDMPTERKATLAREYNAKQFQLEEHIEVHESESSDGNEKNAASECDVPDRMAFIPAGVTEPASPTTNQGSHNGSDVTESNRNLMEENEKLREMMEKLIKAGHEQLTTISSLSGRVKDLEKQLSKRKKLKMHRYKLLDASCSYVAACSYMYLLARKQLNSLDCLCTSCNG